jgi:drug/metabolite transporter superfamily protein YnfA
MVEKWRQLGVGAVGALVLFLYGIVYQPTHFGLVYAAY